MTTKNTQRLLEAVKRAGKQHATKRDLQMCEWFLLCINPATMTRQHSVLGAVPICKRCNDKMDAIQTGSVSKHERSTGHGPANS